MTRYALDAPTLLDVVGREVAVHPDHRLVAPASIRSHALTRMLGAVARGELTDASALDLHERMTTVKIRVLADRVSRRTAWRLAREHGWPTMDDAEYLAVARLQADALVTVDPQMIERATGLVEVRSIDALSAGDG